MRKQVARFLSNTNTAMMEADYKELKMIPGDGGVKCWRGKCKVMCIGNSLFTLHAL